MLLSRPVFHWKEPVIFIASGGGVVGWHLNEDLLNNKSLANHTVRQIDLQQQQITVLAITDG